MDTVYKIVDFLEETKYENLPPKTVENVKKQILDTLGTALGGCNAAGVKENYEMVKDWGGKRESTIFCLGGKYPAPNAAFVNCIMAHALDYDDTHDLAIVHPAVVAVPSGFAVAQAMGNISGKEFIAALAAAMDLGCRMGYSTKLAKPNILEGGWHYSTLYGYFISAAVAGKIYHLDKEKYINALGIAYHQASGNLLCMREGALTKRIGPGFASRGGITAALMALKGITGAKNIFDSDIGIFNLYHAGYDRELLLDGLGKTFASETTSFKPYSCCRANHPYIDAVMRLVKENNIQPEEVQEIIPVHPNSAQILCNPRESKIEPKSIVDAQFSLPWTLACTVTRRKVGVQEFTDKAIKDSSLIAMARKVKPHHDPSMIDKLENPANVLIRTTRGEFETKTGYPLGSPENPLSFDMIKEKFMDCAAFSQMDFSERELSRISNTIINLEDVKDVGKIPRMLVASSNKHNIVDRRKI